MRDLQLWHADFLVAARGLLVAACKRLVVARMQYLVPRPGITPRPPLWEHGVLPTGPGGKSPQTLGFECDCAEPIDHFREKCHHNNIVSPKPVTWCISYLIP